MFFARIALFMSSVIWSFNSVDIAGTKIRRASGVLRSESISPSLVSRLGQYSFFGNIWPRRRLKCRLIAADFLRLRSAVGFS